MSDTAFQIQYRQEHVKGFERRQSLLRLACTNEVQVKGNQAVFLVADSGGATATTRGVNGLIPSRPDNLVQNACVLEEWHDKPIRTGFNLFASQGDGRRIMQETSMAVINRKIDEQIITQLNTATNDTGAAQPVTFKMIKKAMAILGVNDVPMDGTWTGVVSPAMMMGMMDIKQFSYADYVERKPMPDADPVWKDAPGYYKWLGVNWISHPGLPGVGTAAEKCFLFHRAAIGHAAPAELMQTFAGYDEQDDYSYARCTVYMNAKLLQNKGVVVMNHDGSDMVAS